MGGDRGHTQHAERSRDRTQRLVDDAHRIGCHNGMRLPAGARRYELALLDRRRFAVDHLRNGLARHQFTDLQRRQFNLEAAQKSFMLVNSLSLFDLL